MATETAQTRRPVTGSCHCGNIKYVVYINLPVLLPASMKSPMQCVYRCNCTPCQKAGVLHLRLENAPEDFALLSPLDPFTELNGYQCNNKRLNWLFCKTCGVRCFTFAGKHEVAEAELPGYGSEGEKFKFWRPAQGEDGFREGRPEKDSYLSVNAMTIDAGQEGADLVDWADRKVIAYNDALGLGGKPYAGISMKPHEWGCY